MPLLAHSGIRRGLMLLFWTGLSGWVVACLIGLGRACRRHRLSGRPLYRSHRP